MPFKTAVLRLGALVILVLFALIGSSHGAKGKPDGCPHGPRPSTPSFEGCEQHFAGGKPPAFESAQHLVELCHSGWYASLYDTALKTPVYSAYYITPDKAAKGLENKFPRPGWAHTSAISATSQAACMNNLWNGNLGKKRTHDRGHLCPKDIMEYDREAADATFDMTNVVPQLRSCNSPTWAKVEHSIATHIAKNNAMYIVTGATDGGEAPSITKEGVHVPKYIFTAFCDPTSGGSAGFLGLTAEENCGGDAKLGLPLRKVAEIEAKLGTSIFDSELCDTKSVGSQFESMSEAPRDEI